MMCVVMAMKLTYLYSDTETTVTASLYHSGSLQSTSEVMTSDQLSEQNRDLV